MVYGKPVVCLQNSQGPTGWEPERPTSINIVHVG